jgi:hypothetical protein
MNLYDASKQWAERPADQRFWTLQEMHERCAHYAASACQATIRMDEVSVTVSDGNNLALVGREGLPADFTHWSFGQLCDRTKAPANYLRTLPAATAAECLNHGLRAMGTDGAECKTLFHKNGHLVCRAFTSDQYARIWNHEVTSRLLQLGGDWRVPPARPAFDEQPGARQATAADVLDRTGKPGLAVKVGDWIAPAGLYASDHDMFAFMVNEENRIEDGTDGGLARGFFVSNSEVGAAAFRVKRFLYRYVCGNHIVWDAKDVQELRVIHTGRNDRRFGHKLRCELQQYANESGEKDRQRIRACQTTMLGNTKDEVLDKLFGLKVLPRKTLELAYDRAVDDRDRHSGGQSPRSVWGMVQGITALAQETVYADRRMELDQAAGKVMHIAF